MADRHKRDRKKRQKKLNRLIEDGKAKKVHKAWKKLTNPLGHLPEKVWPAEGTEYYDTEEFGK